MDAHLKEKLLRIAINEAEKATQEGNSPFGAVLADLDGNVVDVAHSTANTDIDPTAHAEINLIKKVTKKINSKDLSDYCLISNAQSCSMCFSAAIRAKIKNFIYGCAENHTLIPKIDVFELSKYCEEKIDIDTGILKKECQEQIERARKMTKNNLFNQNI